MLDGAASAARLRARRLWCELSTGLDAAAQNVAVWHALALLVLATAGCGEGDQKRPVPSGTAGSSIARAGSAGAPNGTAAGGHGGVTITNGASGTSGGNESDTTGGVTSNGGSTRHGGGGSTGVASGSSGASEGGATGGANLGGAGANAGAGGSAGIGSSAGGLGSSAGGAGGGAAGRGGGGRGSAGASGGPYPDLRFSGLVSAVELAPLRLATNGPYPGKITLSSGGVDALCGASPSADIATNAETQFLRATGGTGCDKVRIVFTMCEGLYRIVAKKSSGITSLADLAGKRVMAPSGASSAYYLTRMLDAAGLSAGSGAGQVDVVNGSANGSTFAGSGAPDAATIWEPGIEQASEALGSDAVEFQNDASGQAVYRELFNLHTTTDVLADATKRRGVVELVRDLIAASATLRADPTAANALLTGPVGVSASVLANSMKYERFAGTLVSDLLDVMAAEEPWRANIDGRAARSRDDLAQYIDTSVLADAMAGM
jgi:NitT/TauT family transport system substrate-binding protein